MTIEPNERNQSQRQRPAKSSMGYIENIPAGHRLQQRHVKCCCASALLRLLIERSGVSASFLFGDDPIMVRIRLWNRIFQDVTAREPLIKAWVTL